MWRSVRAGVAATVVAALWAAPAHAVLPAGNVVQNPGAEEGASSTDYFAANPPPSWLPADATVTQVRYDMDPTGGLDDPRPSGDPGGTPAFFAGGNGGFDKTIAQVIDLTAAAPEIDTGNVLSRLAAELGGFADQADRAEVVATFRRADDSVAGTQTLPAVTRADRADQTVLIAREAPTALVPAGTRSVEIRVNFIFGGSAGQTYNDGYVDNIGLTFSMGDDALVDNPGAEIGASTVDTVTVASPPAWLAVGNVTQHRYAGAGFPDAAVSAAIGGGSAFFAGGPANPLSRMQQELRFDAATRDAIAAGRAVAGLSAHLGGYLDDTDRAEVVLTFWREDDDDDIVGTLTLPAVTVADRGGATTLLPRSATGQVPAETDYAVVEVVFTRQGNVEPVAYNDGYADNVAVAITTPPDTAIAGPTGPTNDATPTFTFTASPPDGATFECLLQPLSTTFGLCPLDGTFGPLADGSYTLQARATVDGQTDPDPASRSFQVDTAAPVTTIGLQGEQSGAVYTGVVTATVTATDGSGAGVSEVRCAFDPPVVPASFADMGPCDAPRMITEAGDHVIYAASRDAATNVESPLVTRGFRVSFAPGTTILTTPGDPTNDTTPAFTFGSTADPATFECSFGTTEESFAPCTSGAELGPLAAGIYTLRVRAVNADGVRDPSPAAETFTVDTTAPVTTISLSGPQSGGVYTGPVVVMVGATDDNAAGVQATRCALDTPGTPAFGAMGGCMSPRQVTAPGAHTVHAASRDVAGNVEQTVSRTFTIAAPPPPVVTTTGADEVTRTTARITGRIDDRGRPATYRVEFGETTAYGRRSADATTAGTGVADVAVALAGLEPGRDYHARLVADHADGPVAGQDVGFRTAAPDVAAPGLPPDVDFTWSPRADVLVAGTPIRFQATPGDGVQYAWDFDHRPAEGLRAGAGGEAPTHAFAAPAEHDTDKVDRPTGEARRVFTVRLRATAANGAAAEVAHDVVVMPNTPPVVDFTARQPTHGVNEPVSFAPAVRDPDQTDRSAGALSHLEWDFDSTAPGAPGGVDLVCSPDATACHAPDGRLPGTWLREEGGRLVVNFWSRALSAHALTPLAEQDLAALAEPDPAQPTGGLAVKWGNPDRTFFQRHDRRYAHLYDTATLLQQSTFNTDAGEATGATLVTSQSRRAGTRQARSQFLSPGLSPAIRRNVTFFDWRRVTLTAVDTAGGRSSVTHLVPLVPDAPPRLHARFVNAAPPLNAKQGVTPAPNLGRAKAAQTTQKLENVLTTLDTLEFDASQTNDPDGKVEWYALEAGVPEHPPGEKPATCHAIPTGGSTLPSHPALGLDPPPSLGAFSGFNTAVTAAAGTAAPAGAAALLGVGNASASAQRKAGFRAVSTKLKAGQSAQRVTLPNLGDLLAAGPYVHDCLTFFPRTVAPQAITYEGGAAGAGPLRQATEVQRERITTTALVQRDPRLRFRIPKAGKYSVSVAAFDSSGQGAIQRTDGIEIEDPVGQCQRVAGEPLDLGPRTMGFGGQCLSFAGNRTRFQSRRDVDVNGVVLRPDAGAAIAIRKGAGAGLAVTSDLARAGTASLDELDRRAAGATIVVDGDPVAHVDALTSERARDWFLTRAHPRLEQRDEYTYKGSPIAKAGVNVRFRGGGGATSSFHIELPPGFGVGSEALTPTAPVDTSSLNAPRVATLTTNGFAQIARKRRARAAASDLVAGNIDLDGQHLGPIEIKQGSIEFDPLSRGLDVDIKKAVIHVPTTRPSPPEVSLRLKIAGGRLELAEGEVVGGDIPLFAGVDLTGVRFRVVTTPLTVSGGATFTAAKTLSGSLDLTVRPSPLLIAVRGKVSLKGKLDLGSAFVQYDEAHHKALTFGGEFGHKFAGGVSAEAGVAGGITLDGDFAFYIKGEGEICVGICLGAGLLLSHEAVAACGSVKLGLVRVSAGFAFRFAGGFEVFGGCDLDPFVPAQFKGRASLRADAGTGGALTVAPDTEQVAFRFVGQPGTGAPRVTLTSPDGRVFTTPDGPGDYAFSAPGPVAVDGAGTAVTPSALIDRDPVDSVTTFLVARPAAGDWQVTPAADQPPLAEAKVATGRHVEDSALATPVRSAELEGGRVEIGARSYPLSAARASQRTPALPTAVARTLRRSPPIARRHLRGAVVKIPAGVRGEMRLYDVDSEGSNPVATLDLDRVSGSVPVAFTPSPVEGTHQLQALITHVDGVPRQMTVVDSFTVEKAPEPSAPRVDLRRRGRDVWAYVRPGSAGSLASDATTFELTATTSGGERIEQLIDQDDVRALGDGRFRTKLGRFARSERISAAGRMRYAGVAGDAGRDRLGG